MITVSLIVLVGTVTMLVQKFEKYWSFEMKTALFNKRNTNLNWSEWDNFINQKSICKS